MSTDALPSSPQESDKKRKRGEKDATKSSKKRRTINENDYGQASKSENIHAPAAEDFDAEHRARENGSQSSRGLPTPKRRFELARHAPADVFSSATPFTVHTSSLYLPLSPIAQGMPLASLCAEHLSPLILTYFEPLKGFVVSYSNPRLSADPHQASQPEADVLGEIVDEYAATYAWVTADFLVLRPEKGVELEGQVTVQSESHLGLICWNLFNATIPSSRLPKDWQWMGPARRKKKGSGESTGTAPTSYYADATGDKVEGLIRFRVVDFENLPAYGKDRSFISIHGTLKDSAEAEEEDDVEQL